MEKQIYYQAQFSIDGENWVAFNAGRKYDVRKSLDEIKEIYEIMIEFHKLPMNEHCKYHRIIKLIVESEVIE